MACLARYKCRAYVKHTQKVFQVIKQTKKDVLSDFHHQEESPQNKAKQIFWGRIFVVIILG